MKKTTVFLTAALLAAVLAPSASAGRQSREVTESYTMAAGAFVGHGEAHWTLGADYQRFESKSGERAVAFVIEDASGAPVRGHVHIDNNGDGELDDQLDFCGSTAKPIAIDPGAIVEVGTIMGLCDETSPSIVTEGTITATFSR